MYKFVATNANVFSRKRKHLPRACATCRKKKKRCNHDVGQEDVQDQLSLSPNYGAVNEVLGVSQQSFQQHLDGGQSPLSGSRTAASIDKHAVINDLTADHAEQGPPTEAESVNDGPPLDSRFIGDMNPEGVFLAATSPENVRGMPNGSNIGVWLAAKLGDSPNLPEKLKAPPSSLLHGFTPRIQRIFLPILEEECLSILPPAVHFDALCALYFEKVHPILPIVDEATYRSFSSDSPARILLGQGMCLAASMDFSSRRHLVIADGAPLMFKEFGIRLLAAMRVAVEIGIVLDKIILTQALALMSLFVDGPEGSENSSLMIARAVQYVYSLGLHVPDRDGETDIEYARTLFCCVWALDRLNAASHGRAVAMHERDIARCFQESFAKQAPTFRLFLHVIELLDGVVKLYRPRATPSESSVDFALFEDLITRCSATQIPTHLLATIEVLYHAVAILSFRPRPGDNGAFGPTAPRTRQILSAERATAMVGHEFRDQLVLLPFVPYAVSLSLSVNYRELRRSKIPMYRSRARNALEMNCRILETLGEIFWSAAVMADMGNVTLKELDRVYANVAGTELRKSQRHGNFTAKQGNNPYSGSRPTYGVLDANSTVFQDPGFSYFSEMPELDPFEMFDPEFDLDVIDACLEGNLDLSFPTNLQ
ncbi:uncharacterized protein A1O5_03178 [Cladophialophora psammophila CBS 110553]|uniref:Xylanolytic transcriptional activator regulatory domain-containing protein n=1 Tax=Cladophialophora psammophila CBS 110553 TaxID=1182543 RepID=W9WZS1_9EURO|nr:uncharacterized protein A1O5_03178 [Cladophialophora psammophila CBS 110553]EXJ73418.1 hypothetical protein A1O5_03178 [Cladophialophora psammophila CBS 110553]